MKVMRVSDADVNRFPQCRSVLPDVVYLVLGIEIPLDGVRYRILTRGGIAGLFPAGLFEIIEPSLPPTWIANRGNNGFFTLQPAAWSRAGFWEDVFNDVPAAVLDFEGECALLGLELGDR